MNYKKIVLAYSGGLDTSVMIEWLKENYKGLKEQQNTLMKVTYHFT